MIFKLADIILHLDRYLQELISVYSTTTYIFLFFVVFFETGLVVTPFLPGDSLLFAAGALAALDMLNIELTFLIFLTASIIGDTVNYHLGKFIGPKVFKREGSFFFNKKHLWQAQRFYEKHGKKTIVLARFVPIIRTFAPFVAGVGKMSYTIFLFYNVLGAFLWCTLFVFGGYFFGNIAWVQDNFGILVLVIIFVSLLPFIIEIIKYLKIKILQKINHEKTAS
ncbi:MAG TPA: DedA family protein [bacterium]|nr:DedA family protein [bacterium]